MRKAGPPRHHHSRHRNARTMPAGITQPAFDPLKQWIAQPASDRKAIAVMCKARPARAATSGADAGTLHPFIITTWTESCRTLSCVDRKPLQFCAALDSAFLLDSRRRNIHAFRRTINRRPSVPPEEAVCRLRACLGNLGKRSTRQTPPRFSEGRRYRKPLKSCAKRRQHFLRSVSTGGHGRLGSSPSAWQPSGNRQAPVHRETRFPGAFPFAVPAAVIVNGLQSCAKRVCRPR